MRLTLILITLIMLTSCGQKGDLYLPKQYNFQLFTT